MGRWEMVRGRLGSVLGVVGNGRNHGRGGLGFGGKRVIVPKWLQVLKEKNLGKDSQKLALHLSFLFHFLFKPNVLFYKLGFLKSLMLLSCDIARTSSDTKVFTNEMEILIMLEPKSNTIFRKEHLKIDRKYPVPSRVKFITLCSGHDIQTCYEVMYGFLKVSKLPQTLLSYSFHKCTRGTRLRECMRDYCLDDDLQENLKIKS
ncbi:hypothetical protein Tco_0691067 [Tanacetum coccineum]